MSSLFKKKKHAELVAFLIFGRRTGRDQLEWGPAGDGGIMLKDPKPSKTQIKDISQRLFITKQVYFLYYLVLII